MPRLGNSPAKSSSSKIVPPLRRASACGGCRWGRRRGRRGRSVRGRVRRGAGAGTSSWAPLRRGMRAYPHRVRHASRIRQYLHHAALRSARPPSARRATLTSITGIPPVVRAPGCWRTRGAFLFAPRSLAERALRAKQRRHEGSARVGPRKFSRSETRRAPSRRVSGTSVCQVTAETVPSRSAQSFLKTTSEMRRLRDRSASLSDLPSASLRR